MTDEPKNPQPRLVRPKVFREAQERLRLKEEWDSISEQERQARLDAMWSAEADTRYQRAREKMLALLDSGAAAAFLVEVTGFMSKRGLRLLKRTAALPGRDGRQARWILLECIRLAARMEEQVERPAPRGPAIKVRTHFAKDGDKYFGPVDLFDKGPKVKVTVKYPSRDTGEESENEPG